MYDEATDREPDERETPGAEEAPIWTWHFSTTPNQVAIFINSPTPLPQGGSVGIRRRQRVPHLLLRVAGYAWRSAPA